MNKTTLTLSFPEDIDTAARLIQKGECVAVKTETVYGLAGDANNPLAIESIFQAKA